MNKLAAALMIVGVMSGCSPSDEPAVARAGIFTTAGGTREWRLEPPPPDTIRTVARRVWYGEGASLLASPSRDGARFAHIDSWTGDILVRDLATGEEVRVTDNTAPFRPGYGMFPRFSPGGDRVVYTWWEEGVGNQLRMAEVGGADPIVLLTVDSWVQAGDWSLDGSWIAALRSDTVGNNEIILVATDDGSVRVVESTGRREPGSMTFSPDGRFLLYDVPTDPENEDSRDLYVVPVEGGQPRRIVDHPANDKVLGWSPEGSHVLFESDRTGTPGAWLLPVAGAEASGPPALLKPDFWLARPMGFAGDGRFFYGVRVSSRDILVATLDATTSEVVGEPQAGSSRSLSVSSWPEWSPDSRQLAFLARRSPFHRSASLAVRSMDTGAERRMWLPYSLGYPFQPLWLSDGRSILLRTGSKVHRADIVTGEVEELFDVGGGSIYGYDDFPDGDAIAYAHDAGGPDRIVVRDLASGEEREVYRQPEDVGQLREVAVSPDGETLAVWRVSQDMSVFLLPSAGGEPKELVTGFAGAPAWTPDGRALLLRVYDEDPRESRSRGTHIARVDVDTGEMHDLGLPMESWGQIRLSPDGRLLAYVHGGWADEVWVMEEFLPGRDDE